MNKSIYFLVAGLFAIIACSKKNENPVITPFVYTTDTVIVIDVAEPSGLAFSQLNDALYTVSDYSGKIYKISFEGETLSELPFIGSDMEGIDVDKSNGNIYVVEEVLQRIDHLNQYGTLINSISSVHIETAEIDRGFEGIAKNGDTLYVLFEKNPGLLIKYHIPSNKWTQTELNFALDYSGIDFDNSDNTLWIVGHESACLYHCRLNGSLINSQPVAVDQAEGVAVDRDKNVAWIVSDLGNKLHRIVLKI